MGVAQRRKGRPTEYRRNDSYFRWRRIEAFARDHTPENYGGVSTISRIGTTDYGKNTAFRAPISSREASWCPKTTRGYRKSATI